VRDITETFQKRFWNN